MTKLSGTLPWTRSCFVCGQDNPHGLQLKSKILDGAVVLEHTARQEDVGYSHLVHGGISMTLMDEVMTWAAIVAMGKMCVSAEINSRFRRPVEVGMRLKVVGRVEKSTPRLCLTVAEVFDPSGHVLTSATGKYLPMRGEGVHLSEKDFVNDPAVIRLSDIHRE